MGLTELVGEGEIVDTEVCVGVNVEDGVGENVGVAGFWTREETAMTTFVYTYCVPEMKSERNFGKLIFLIIGCGDGRVEGETPNMESTG